MFRAMTVRDLLLFGLPLLLLVPFSKAGQAADADKKISFTSFRVSEPGVASDDPRLVSTRKGLILTWLGDQRWGYHRDARGWSLSRALYKEGTKTFDVLEEIKPEKEIVKERLENGGRVVSFYERVFRYAVLDGPSLLLASRHHDDPERLPVEIKIWEIIPEEGTKKYKVLERGQVPFDELYPKPARGEQRRTSTFDTKALSFLRCKNVKGAPLLIVSSFYTDIWTSDSPDEGKTWSPLQVIARDVDRLGDVVQTPQGELLLFTIAKSSLGIMRSTDAKKWGKPAPIHFEQKVDRCAACMAKDGTLWLAFSAMNNKRSSIFLTRSTDDGKTWAKPIPVTETNQAARIPLFLGEEEGREVTMAIEGKNLVMAFTRRLEKKDAEGKRVKEPKDGIEAFVNQPKNEIWAAVKELEEIKFPAVEKK